MHALCMAAVFAFAGSWLPTFAAQEKSAAVAASPTADAIAGAKKEFENIKAGREAALLPKSGLPRVNLPELRATAPAVALGMKPKIAAPESKPSNWLVDAMEKQAKVEDRRGATSRTRDRDGKAAPASPEDREVGGADREFSPAAGSEERDASVVANPLTRYLEDWMTPQDYALLKPGLESVEPGVAAKTSGGMVPPAPAATVGIGREFIFGGGPASPAAVVPVPRENPYLQSLRPHPAISAGVMSSKPIAPAVLSAPRTVTIAPPPPAPPAPTKIPEFAKPPVDDKYFKQLKRF